MATPDRIKIGDRFGKLIVTQIIPGSKQLARRYICACDCGGSTNTIAQCLLRKKMSTKTCGCLRHDAVARNRQTHGMTDSRTYTSWAGMKRRCERPESPSYEHYGGRGIKVCDRWQKFENFYADMGERPDGRSIDRIDVNGHYEPDNCRWATPKEQSNNRTDNTWIDFCGERMTIAQAARKVGISFTSMYRRIQKGHPLNSPPRTRIAKR